MKHLGVTGTRRGMTWQQKDMFSHLLAVAKLRGFSYFHDGDCIGVDVEACDMAQIHDYVTVGHPSTAKTRAFREGRDFMHEPLPPLSRNADIVDSCHLIVGCPGEDHEVLRSGTWACLRYAGKAEKRTVIIWPGGEISTYPEGYNGNRRAVLP